MSGPFEMRVVIRPAYDLRIEATLAPMLIGQEQVIAIETRNAQTGALLDHDGLRLRLLAPRRPRGEESVSTFGGALAAEVVAFEKESTGRYLVTLRLPLTVEAVGDWILGGEGLDDGGAVVSYAETSIRAMAGQMRAVG